MKKFFITLIIILISTPLFSQSFYRYQGKKIDLKEDSTIFVIQIDKQQLAEKQNSILKEQMQKGDIEFFQKMPNNRFLIVGPKPQPENYDYFSNVYRNDGNGVVIILPRIVVMFKQGANLKPVLNKYEGKLVKDSGTKQKYILKCNVNQSKEVLKLVNELDSRDDVIWCEPEFLSDYKVDNTLYPQQYYLNNTGQDGGTSGIDINVEPAWNITSGNSSITVAVIDAGVDRDHEDMGTRVLEGFTIGNATGDGEPQNANSLDTKYHGMACAGIVAASNNAIGIRGVASNVNILPVNIVPDATFIDWQGTKIYGFGTNIEIAEAINWAWRRADILSCSWGGGNPSNDITLAIDSARTFGRNGYGSVVVFASGNSWPGATDVSYPANVNGVITVGAIDNQGTIWNYSQRGISMDLVAPSGNIGSNGNVRTTDRMGNLGEDNGNYMDNFGGTSAACPQVSGVAALMLSVNPFLTEAEVRTTLQQTATDMGASGFDNTYGFGRVNAYAAVNAVNPYISGPTLICSSDYYEVENIPNGINVTWHISPNYSVFQLTPDVPSTNQVLIKNNKWYSATTTLFASMNDRFGNPVVVTKTIANDNDNSSVQNGSYNQQACIAYNNSFPSQSGTLNGNAIFLYPGCMTEVTLNNMFGRTVSLSGSAQPLFWSYQSSNNTLYLQLPNQPGIPFTFSITGDGACYNKTLVFFAYSGYSLVFSPNPTTGETTLTISSGTETETLNSASVGNDTFDDNAEWDMEIYSPMQALKTKKTKLKGKSTTIQTAGWMEGIYTVRVKYKDEILTGKLVVKR